MIKFGVGLFDNSDSFPFSTVRTSENTSNVQSKLVYSKNRAEFLRTAKVTNNPDLFSTTNWATLYPSEQAGGFHLKNKSCYSK